MLESASGPEPSDPTPGSRWTASGFIIGQTLGLPRVFRSSLGQLRSGLVLKLLRVCGRWRAWNILLVEMHPLDFSQK